MSAPLLSHSLVEVSRFVELLLLLSFYYCIVEHQPNNCGRIISLPPHTQYATIIILHERVGTVDKY